MEQKKEAEEGAGIGWKMKRSEGGGVEMMADGSGRLHSI